MLESRQVDEAVDQLVQSTVHEIQERTLSEVRAAADRANVDLKVAFEAADKRQTGGLTPSAGVRIIEQELPRLSKPTADRLELLLTRYQRNGFLEIARLVEDLVAPRFGGEDRKPSKPLPARADSKKVDTLLSRIASQCSKEDIADLARRLQQQERGKSTGVITEQGFRGQLAAALPQVRLTEDDEYLLADHFAAGGPRGQVDYRSFLDALTQAQKSSGGAAARPSLTATQEQKLRSAAGEIEEKKALAALTLALRGRDFRNTGYLSEKQVTDAFAEVSIKLVPADARAILSCVPPNARGELPYKELLELLFDPQTAAQLYSASDASLRNDTWRTDRRTTEPSKSFVAPREPRGPASGPLGEIGQLLISTGKNYEQTLLDSLGPDAQASQPFISDGELMSGLSTLQIRLKTHQRSEIQQYFKSKARGGRVDLGGFLRAVGLPP